MRNYQRAAFAACMLLLAPLVGGCQYFGNLAQLAEIGTASIANPVTPDRLNQLEAASSIIFAGLGAWKKDCAAGVIPAACYDQIAAVQVYTQKIPPYLTQLRNFVKNNDQVNATVVWNEVSETIANVKAQAAQSNVNIGG